jgi:hypothetical protein
MGYHYTTLFTPCSPRPFGYCGGWPSLTNGLGSTACDITFGLPPLSSDSARTTREHDELALGPVEPEPFDERHNGAAGLGIP